VIAAPDRRPARLPFLELATVTLRLSLCLSLLLALAGCPTEEPVPDPTPTPSPALAIEGAHAVAVGDQLQLSVSTLDGTDAGYLWSSSDDAIATVDAAGRVGGVAPGEASITAVGEDTGASAEHPVVVTAVPVDVAVTVSVSGAFYLQVGQSADLVAATINGADSSYAWSVDDDSVATVDGDGRLAGVRPGAVTVTATGADSGASGSLGVVVATVVPHQDEWAGSAHATVDAEAFRHWDDQGVIPTACARCHSTPGYRDYLGADGSEPGVVDAEVPIGTTVECEACHNDVALTLDTVTFPSGAVVDGLGAEARCMTCHQGRSSGDSVDDAIALAAPPDDDTVSSDLGFINIHYYAAGATLMAGLARGGYQYADHTYDVRFRHVARADTCVECHSPHTLQVQLETCAQCHEGVTAVEDLRDVRMMASASVDFDGDGDLDEGIYHELEGVRAAALAAVQAYAAEAGAPICYDGASYPYYFADTDGDGACDADEATFGNAYAAWTARLLRGAYNVQVASKDPGAFAHNAKYIIELLYDSAMDLNGALAAPADLSAMRRNDPGHFNGSGEPARHWDGDEDVSASCARCHGGAEGFRFYLEHGVGAEVLEQGNGLDCETCHDTFADVDDPADAYAVVEVDDFALSDGSRFSQPDASSNLCATCHSGRKVGADVDASIASSNLRFQNVHYLPAGGVILGGEGHLGYEYGVNDYAGRKEGHFGGDGCVDCHDPLVTLHSFDVGESFDAGNCLPCHFQTGTIADFRAPSRTDDYDGDGDATEPMAAELETMAAAVLAAMHDAVGLCYDAHAYPYFFAGGDTDGACLPGEAVSSNGFSAWTAATLKASYNYQVYSKDPGAWAHNFDYLAQLLYDSLEDLGGDPAGAGWLRPTP
jgi:hypothetical protein